MGSRGSSSATNNRVVRTTAEGTPRERAEKMIQLMRDAGMDPVYSIEETERLIKKRDAEAIELSKPPRLRKYTEEWRVENTKIRDRVMKKYPGATLGDTGVIEATSKHVAEGLAKDLIKAGKRQEGVYDRTYTSYNRRTKTWEVIYD